MLKNIVFDMGNVLLFWNPLQACLRHCPDEETAVSVCEQLFLCPDWPKYIDTGLLKEDEYTAFKVSQAAKEDQPYIQAVMSDYWLDSLYPVPGMEALTGELLSSGYRLYILSNVGSRFHTYSNKIRYLKSFSGKLISSEEHLMKPDPAIYQRLCEKYGLLPKETLFVDDVQKNIDGAVSCGIHGLCFQGNADEVRRAIEAINC